MGKTRVILKMNKILRRELDYLKKVLGIKTDPEVVRYAVHALYERERAREMVVRSHE